MFYTPMYIIFLVCVCVSVCVCVRACVAVFRAPFERNEVGISLVNSDVYTSRGCHANHDNAKWCPRFLSRTRNTFRGKKRPNLPVCEYRWFGGPRRKSHKWIRYYFLLGTVSATMETRTMQILVSRFRGCLKKWNIMENDYTSPLCIYYFQVVTRIINNKLLIYSNTILRLTLFTSLT